MSIQSTTYIPSLLGEWPNCASIDEVCFFLNFLWLIYYSLIFRIMSIIPTKIHENFIKKKRKQNPLLTIGQNLPIVKGYVLFLGV